MAFQAALTAPDHQCLKPTRFSVVITAEQRAAFGELLFKPWQTWAKPMRFSWSE